jgi:hypothetical protein
VELEWELEWEYRYEIDSEQLAMNSRLAHKNLIIYGE